MVEIALAYACIAGIVVFLVVSMYISYLQFKNSADKMYRTADKHNWHKKGRISPAH